MNVEKKPRLPILFILILISLILLSIIRLFFTGSIYVGFSFLPKFLVFLIIIYSVISNIGYIVSAIYCFKLRKWARSAILILAVMQISYMLFFSLPMGKKSMEVFKESPQAIEKLEAGYYSLPASMREGESLTLDKYKSLVFKKLTDVSKKVNMAAIIYMAVFIFLVTRKGLKQRFIN